MNELQFHTENLLEAAQLTVATYRDQFEQEQVEPLKGRISSLMRNVGKLRNCIVKRSSNG